MRLPSFSIAEMMAIIALVALDCLAIRMGSPLTVYCLVYGGLVIQAALVIALVLVFRRRRRMEKLPPFLIEFVVVGWICHLVYVAVCDQAAQSLDRHMVHTLTPLLAVTGFQSNSTADVICRIGIGMSYLTAPQLAAALVSGWISQRWSM